MNCGKYRHPHKDADGLKAIRVAPAWCNSAWRFLVLDELTPAVMVRLGITRERKAELRRHANKEWAEFCAPPYIEWLIRQADIAPARPVRAAVFTPGSGSCFQRQVGAARREIEAWSFGTDEFQVEWDDLPERLRDLRAMKLDEMRDRYTQKVIAEATGYSQPKVSRRSRRGKELKGILERLQAVEQLQREQLELDRQYRKELHQVMLDVAALPARLHRLDRADAVKAAEELTAHLQ